MLEACFETLIKNGYYFDKDKLNFVGSSYHHSGITCGYDKYDNQHNNNISNNLTVQSLFAFKC